MTTRRILRECGIFATLTDEELGEIAVIASEKQFEAGTVIFQEGDNAGELYVVKEGKVALQMTLPAAQAPALGRVTIDMITSNQMFGWSAVVPPNTYTLTAVCLQRASIIVLDSAKLSQLLQDNPHMGYEVMKGFIKVVASRLEDTRHVLLSERALT